MAGVGARDAEGQQGVQGKCWVVLGLGVTRVHLPLAEGLGWGLERLQSMTPHDASPGPDQAQPWDGGWDGGWGGRGSALLLHPLELPDPQIITR